MQEAFKFTAVHVDVLDELYVVHVYVILRANGQLLQPAGKSEIRSIHSFHLITRGCMYLVEMRLKTELKLLQLRENRTPQAEFFSSAAYWFPSRYVWMK